MSVFDLNKPQKPKFDIICTRAQEVQIKPSPTGHAILVWSQNFVDTTGKSYYGEHSLQYVQIYGGKNRSFVPVFDNQIQEIRWTKTGDNFIAISGLQPGTATLFDKNANPVFEFGKRYRNTVRICPFSNGILIGGFGNLAGEVDVWTLSDHVEVGNFKAYCTVGVEWSPDGNHIMTCSTFPRMKVDNEIKIYMPNGQLLCEKSYKEGELYEVMWLQHSADKFI